VWLVFAGCAHAEDAPRHLVLAASDEAAPILNELAPKFQEQSGIKVDLMIRPWADAVALARDGKVDAIMTDNPDSEAQLLASKDVSKMVDVMYAELVVVGPAGDPARIAGMASAVHAFAAIGRTQSTFISRGDRSGVHRTEREIWQEAGFPKPGDAGDWYREVKGDMKAVIAEAARRGAYALTDKAEWLQIPDHGQLVVMVADDPRLQQRFAIALVNPDKHKGVNADAAQKFTDWLVTRDIQLLIGRYALNGEGAYIPQFGLSGR
jgi:tungstate transport system substrate-binding protein